MGSVQGDAEEGCGVAARLVRLLHPYEARLRGVQALLVWETPSRSALMLLGVNGAFWLLSVTCLRSYTLLAVAVIAGLLLYQWAILPTLHTEAQENEHGDGETETTKAGCLLSLEELCSYLAEAWESLTLYNRELVAYRTLHPGKFCLRVCATCTGLAVLGHYVPGIMISYIIVLSVLLWPMVVYHELMQKMYTRIEPVLMKLDYSMRGQGLSQSHRRRLRVSEHEGGGSADTDTDSDSGEELSAFCGKMDVTRTALALAITDSELSDEEASFLESEGFSLSRGNTPPPSIELYEDLERHTTGNKTDGNAQQDMPEYPQSDNLAEREATVDVTPQTLKTKIPREAHTMETLGLGSVMQDDVDDDSTQKKQVKCAHLKHGIESDIVAEKSVDDFKVEDRSEMVKNVGFVCMKPLRKAESEISSQPVSAERSNVISLAAHTTIVAGSDDQKVTESATSVHTAESDVAKVGSQDDEEFVILDRADVEQFGEDMMGSALQETSGLMGNLFG
uniref:reticulophagy regulator 2-like n=1 Tax=Myxine glutinosa TaxID=7769 RepID=UPI00358F02DD